MGVAEKGIWDVPRDGTWLLLLDHYGGSSTRTQQETMELLCNVDYERSFLPTLGGGLWVKMREGWEGD